MSSDLLIPSLVAPTLTTPYDPNKMSDEATPVTLAHALEAARDVAAM